MPDEPDVSRRRRPRRARSERLEYHRGRGRQSAPRPAEPEALDGSPSRTTGPPRSRSRTLPNGRGTERWTPDPSDRGIRRGVHAGGAHRSPRTPNPPNQPNRRLTRRPRGEDEEAMVTANPPMPDIAAPEADRADVRGAREVTGLPALDETGRRAERSRRRAPAPAGDRDRQPEGRGGQDHHRGEPGGRARRGGLPRARRRPRPAGQRVDRPRDQPPRRGVVGLRRDHDRRPRPRLRRAHEPQEPLRAARPPSTSRAPRSSWSRPSAASSSSAGPSTWSAPSTTSSSSTAHPRSACSPSTGWPPPTT